MPAHLTILASGSSGNAALLHAGRSGLLIDCGIGPRVLAHRLAVVGLQWANVTGVVLTHTHGDHWKRLTLAHLARLRIPFFAHASHLADLDSTSADLQTLTKHNLVRTYQPGEPFEPVAGVTTRAVRLPHDSEPTYGFRFDGRCPETGGGWSLGFASDLGVGTPELVRAFSGVNVLALEFNHDEVLERTSGRPQHLIARVLGRTGHLSNREAAALSHEILVPGAPRVQSLVQLHLSRHCNRPELAIDAGREALARIAPKSRLWTASQDIPCGPIPISGQSAQAIHPAGSLAAIPALVHQPRLPGFD